MPGSRLWGSFNRRQTQSNPVGCCPSCYETGWTRRFALPMFALEAVTIAESTVEATIGKAGRGTGLKCRS